MNITYHDLNTGQEWTATHATFQSVADAASYARKSCKMHARQGRVVQVVGVKAV